MSNPVDKLNTSDELQTRISLLREIQFFENLSHEKLGKIAKHLEAKKYQAGQRVLNQDQPVAGVFLLQAGEVQILVSNEQTGQEELIAQGYKGECFGEMSTLREDLPASASVVCANECHFLFIARNDFIRYVNDFNLWSYFVNILAARLQQTNHRMTEVMRHLKQGMVQVDTKGLITGKFSMGFVRLTGIEINRLHGASFKDLVFGDCHDSIQKWSSNFSLAILSNPQQAELILNLLPAECSFSHPEKGPRLFKVSYDLCIYQKKVIGMDIGLEDVTQVRELAKKSEELESEKKVIGEIYTKPETFRTLLNLIIEIRRNLASAEFSLKSKKISKEGLRLWLGNIHSLKGTSQFLKLFELGEAAHKLESILSESLESLQFSNQTLPKFQQGKKDLEKQFGYIDDILENMGDETRKRMTAELVMSKREINDLEKVLDSGSQAFSIFQKARKIPSQNLVEGWKVELERIGKRLSKKMIFRHIGESIPMPGNIYNALKIPLIHILRNCAEHGIESIDERKIVGKPVIGLITFKADLDEQFYYIQIQDNGRGINKDQIYAKALLVANQNPVLKPKIKALLSENRLLAILFLPGFSTSETVTDLSGRGVGLDVVQRAAANAGGVISMKSVPEKGTKFTLSFPR